MATTAATATPACVDAASIPLLLLRPSSSHLLLLLTVSTEFDLTWYVFRRGTLFHFESQSMGTFASLNNHNSRKAAHSQWRVLLADDPASQGKVPSAKASNIWLGCTVFAWGFLGLAGSQFTAGLNPNLLIKPPKPKPYTR